MPRISLSSLFPNSRKRIPLTRPASRQADQVAAVKLAARKRVSLVAGPSAGGGTARRAALAIGLSVMCLAAGAGGWVFLHRPDPIVSAQRLMMKDDMRGAELYIRQALQRHPLNPRATFMLGQVDMAQGKFGGAELEFKRARDRGYDPVAITFPLGDAYLRQRHFEALLRDFDPTNAVPGARADVLAVRASAQLELEDIPAATASSAESEALAPDGRAVLLVAARVALARGDLDGAGKRLTHLLTQEPKQIDAALLQAEVALRRNDADGAMRISRAILADKPVSVEARLMEARALAQLGQAAAATADVKQILALSPKNVGANYLGATLALQRRDYAAADTYLNSLSLVIGRLPRGFYLVAVAKLGIGDPALAEEAVNKYLADAPASVPARKLQVALQLANHKPQAALLLLGSKPLANSQDADTFNLTAQAQSMMGDRVAAKDSLLAAAKLAPSDAGILNELAATQLSLGETESAEADLRRSLQIAPTQTAASEAIVQTALARGDFTGAAADIDRLRSSQGDTEQVGLLAAQVKIATLDMAGAKAQLADLLRRFPQSRPVRMTLARLRSMDGDQHGAEALLEDQVKLHPDDEATLVLLLAELSRTHQVERAVGVAQAAHAAMPNNGDITDLLATAYVENHDPARAVALLDRSDLQKTLSSGALRASALVADGRTDEAETAYGYLLRQYPASVRLRLEFAALLANGKKDDRADGVLREGLKDAPGNPYLLGAIVTLKLQRGGIAAALAAASALRQDSRNLPAADWLAGNAWLAAHDPVQAATAFQAAFQLRPTSELAIRTARSLAGTGGKLPAIALLSKWVAGHPTDLAAQELLGDLHLEQGRLPEAERSFGVVVASGQADAQTLNNLAWLEQKKGNVPLAADYAERAYYLQPTAKVADTLGWILACQGDRQRALPLLAQAAANPEAKSQATAAYHYASALESAGRHDEARVQLARSLGQQVVFPERAEAQTLLGHLQ